jgi:hypothetical protein
MRRSVLDWEYRSIQELCTWYGGTASLALKSHSRFESGQPLFKELDMKSTDPKKILENRKRILKALEKSESRGGKDKVRAKTHYREGLKKLQDSCTQHKWEWYNLGPYADSYWECLYCGAKK